MFLPSYPRFKAGIHLKGPGIDSRLTMSGMTILMDPVFPFREDKLYGNNTLFFLPWRSVLPREQDEISFHLIISQKPMGFGGPAEREGQI